METKDLSKEVRFQLRRQDCFLPVEDAKKLLEEAEFGTLAMVDREHDEPYATPISFVWRGNAIYFHAAMAGRKFEILRAGTPVHFSVVARPKPLFANKFTSLFESAMVFGDCVLIEDEAEKKSALVWLCEKYFPPEQAAFAAEYAERSLERTAVFKIVPAAITGKRKTH